MAHIMDGHGYAAVDQNGTVYGVGESPDLALRDADDEWSSSRDGAPPLWRVWWCTDAAVCFVRQHGYVRSKLYSHQTNGVPVVGLAEEADALNGVEP